MLASTQEYRNTVEFVPRRKDYVVQNKDLEFTSVNIFEQTTEERYLSNLAEGFKNAR